ncbi:MAG TPA: hypothetical protein VMR18_02385 [Candidatus Saccharimonadales bacterium]|nr:hypothetical protein [Candidatus Saccharimonadales bacterium]
MESRDAVSAWLVGFCVVLILLIGSIIYGVSLNKQKTQLSNELNVTKTSLSQLTSSNAQQRQSCIANGENNGGGGVTASLLSSIVSACQAEYPTN